MSKKLTYMTFGYVFAALNISLINSKFNIVGLFFGIVALVLFIRALIIRK